MNFRGFMNDQEAARSLIESPGETWRRGRGLAKPEDELAAVLHYARMRFPAGGKSLTIQAPHDESAVYKELMREAESMSERGLVFIDREANGYTYIGRPDLVRDAMRLTMRRKPELLADEEQHRAIGKMLGYDDDAIEDFVKEFARKRALRYDID